MKKLQRGLSLVLLLAMLASLLCAGASAKTSPTGQTVGAVLLYAKNSAGEDVLVSHVTVSELEADLKAGKIDSTNHNYSVLDRYVTPVHQEGKGFTVPELVSYMQAKSTEAAVRSAKLGFAGTDKISFWEMDQTGFDDLDTYTFNDLYGAARYNFSLLYEYWDYQTQDYADPSGLLSRSAAIDKIFASGEAERVILSVEAFSQRYVETASMFNTGNFNMENLWENNQKQDTQRTLRLLMPMTERDLRDKVSTASNTRYWVSRIRLDMQNKPALTSGGRVAAPTAVLTKSGDSYYVSFSCATPGAVILYNANPASPSYMPCELYTGGKVSVPKEAVKNGTLTMTCQAVRDGWTDAGVQTLELKVSADSGTVEIDDELEKLPDETETPQFTDVPANAWYAQCVSELSAAGVIGGYPDGTFRPTRNVTAGEALKLILLAAGYQTEAASGGHWAQPYLDCAQKNGIVTGALALDEPVTRLTVAGILARANGIAPETAEKSFTDTKDPYAAALRKAGLMEGYPNGGFAPDKTLTRAELSMLLYRMRTEKSH